jgi:hypothetical protein
MDGYTRKERLFENNVKQVVYNNTETTQMYVVRMHHDKIVVIDTYLDPIIGRDKVVIKRVYKRETYVIYHDPYRVVKFQDGYVTTQYVVPQRVMVIPEISDFYGCTYREVEKLLAPNLFELVDHPYHTHFLYKYPELCRGRLKKGLKQLFGVSGPSALEQLKLILSGANGQAYHTHVSLRGLLPWDTQVHLARKVAMIINQRCRVLFTKVSKNMLLRIGSEDYNRHIQDTFKMYKALWKPKYKKRVRAILSRARTWKQLHDELSDFQRLQKVKNVTYCLHSDFKSLFDLLSSVDFMGHTIRPPKDLYEVYRWGQEQHHCIANYARHHGRHVILLGVYKNEELVYNIMLATGNYRTMQFYGKHNSIPSEDLEMAFRHLMSLMYQEPVIG